MLSKTLKVTDGTRKRRKKHMATDIVIAIFSNILQPNSVGIFTRGTNRCPLHCRRDGKLPWMTCPFAQGAVLCSQVWQLQRHAQQQSSLRRGRSARRVECGCLEEQIWFGRSHPRQEESWSQRWVEKPKMILKSSPTSTYAILMQVKVKCACL